MSLVSRHIGRARCTGQNRCKIAGRPSQRQRETHPEAGRAASDCGKERGQGIHRAVDSHVQVVSAHLRSNMQ